MWDHLNKDCITGSNNEQASNSKNAVAAFLVLVFLFLSCNSLHIHLFHIKTFIKVTLHSENFGKLCILSVTNI